MLGRIAAAAAAALVALPLLHALGVPPPHHSLTVLRTTLSRALPPPPPPAAPHLRSEHHLDDCVHSSLRSADNGLALTPPMGWRSWNCYHGNVNQSSIEATIDAIADTSRGTSLLALGFSDVGVDDGWQACGTGRALDNHTSFHAADGTPLVNFTKFADVKAMVAYGHKNKGMVSTQRNPHQKLEDQPSERLRVV